MKKFFFVILIAAFLPLAKADAYMMGWRSNTNFSEGQNYSMQFMMNPENFQKMQSFMPRLNQGQLSSDEQRQMWAIMQNRSENYAPFPGYGMMGAGMMGNWGVFYWISAISTVLFWAVMLLAIYALAKWLKKSGQSK